MTITQNIPEDNHFLSRFSTTITKNLNKKGFGTNHNSAFERENPDIFIIVNPDIKLIQKFNLDKMISKINSNQVSITSPVIVDKNGSVEDYKRSDLMPINLIKRKLLELSLVTI